MLKEILKGFGFYIIGGICILIGISYWLFGMGIPDILRLILIIVPIIFGSALIIIGRKIVNRA